MSRMGGYALEMQELDIDGPYVENEPDYTSDDSPLPELSGTGLEPLSNQPRNHHGQNLRHATEQLPQTI